MEERVIKRRKRHQKPTLMQIKALQYINQGLSKRSAMIKAGYSKKTAGQPGKLLMNRAGVKNALMSMAGKLEDAGLTTDYMVLKFKEWLDAQKVHGSLTEPDALVPDYKTQIEAYKIWEKYKFPEGVVKNGVKRKLTIEEFIQSPEEPSET